MSADKNAPSVVTFAELLMIALLALSMLLLFYPRYSIDHLIASEESNYDLTLIYLRNIARAYPNDPKNWERLMQVALKAGETKLAQQIYRTHFQHAKTDAQMVMMSAYKLLKTRYLQERDKAKKEVLRAQLLRTMEQFLQNRHPSLWYLVMRDARSLALARMELKARRKMLSYTDRPDPSDVLAAFRLAVGLGRSKEAIALLEEGYKKSHDPTLARKLARYAAWRDDRKAGRLYADLYRHNHHEEELLLAMESYFRAKEPKKALALLHTYAKMALHDDATAAKIIKLLLANGMVAQARSVTLEAMRMRGVLP